MSAPYRPDNDSRFTHGLIIDVAKALDAHGYQVMADDEDRGRRLVDLQQALFGFLYTQGHGRPGGPDEPPANLPSVDEVQAVLEDIRLLGLGRTPETERNAGIPDGLVRSRVMARKRRLIDRIDPTFYDRHPATDADDDASRHRLEAFVSASEAGSTPSEVAR